MDLESWDALDKDMTKKFLQVVLVSHVLDRSEDKVIHCFKEQRTPCASGFSLVKDHLWSFRRIYTIKESVPTNRFLERRCN